MTTGFTVYVICMPIPPSSSPNIKVYENIIGMTRIPEYAKDPTYPYGVRLLRTDGHDTIEHLMPVIVTREAPLAAPESEARP